MRKLSAAALVILTLTLALSGCGRKTLDPDAKLNADVARYALPETIARYGDEVKAHPTAANYDLLARALAAARQPKEARQALEKAVSLDPDYEPSAILLGRTLLQENKGDSTEQMMRSLLEKHSGSAEAAELLCRALTKQNRAAEAVPVADQAIRANGKNAQLYWARADAKAILKQYDEAYKDYRHAMKLAPKNLALQMSYIQGLILGGKTDEAAKAVAEPLKLAPNSADVHFMAASTFHQAGQVEEALRQYKETLVINPGMVPAANNLALLLADRGQDTGTAVAWARKAAVLAPHNIAVADTLGWALARDGQYQEALPILRQVRQSWTNPTVAYHLGWTLVQAGQKPEGAKLLEEAAKSNDPSAADARKALAEIH